MAFAVGDVVYSQAALTWNVKQGADSEFWVARNFPIVARTPGEDRGNWYTAPLQCHPGGPGLGLRGRDLAAQGRDKTKRMVVGETALCCEVGGRTCRKALPAASASVDCFHSSIGLGA